jgi:tetratricopeptide (TPR) repeat protein
MSEPEQSTAAANSQYAAPKTRWRLRRILTFFLVGMFLLGGLRLLTIEVALWRAEVALEARAHHQALFPLKLANFLDSDNADGQYLLARCYRRLGRYEKVGEHLSRARDLGFDVQKLQREQWLALAATGQYMEVRAHWAELFSDAGSDGPEISKAYVTGCLSQLQLNDARKVIAAWEQDFPEDPDPHLLRGALAESLIDWAAARDAFQEALKREDDSVAAQLGLARSLIQLGKFDEASQRLESLIEQSPGDVEARVLLAVALERQKQHEPARKLLKAVLASSSNNPEALKALGRIELKAGNAAEALKSLESAVKQRPADAELRYSYALALRNVGRGDEAQDDFAFVQESTKPLLRLSRMTRKMLAEPRNLKLRHDIATITWKYRSRAEGARWFESLLVLSPTHRPSHAALALHYREIGDEKKHVWHAERAKPPIAEPK